LQSELSRLDTQELFSAQKRFRPQDADNSEIIEVDMSVHGLKTATQKSLVRKYEEEFKLKELIKQQQKESEKQMNYSSSIVSKISMTNGDNLNSKRSKFTNDQVFSKNNYASNNSGNNNKNQIIIVDSDSSLNSDRRNHMSSCKNSKEAGGAPNRLGINMPELEHLELQVNLEKDQENSYFQQLYHEMDKDNAQIHESHNRNIDGNIFSPNEYQMMMNNDQGVQLNLKRISKNQFDSKKDSDAKTGNGMMVKAQASEYNQRSAKRNYNDEGHQQIENSGHQSHDSHYEQRELQEEYHARAVDTNDCNEEQDLIQLLKNQKHEVYSNKAAGSNKPEDVLQRIENEKNLIAQQLPLEMIQERQSEFSQSIITNAARINTNRSKQSRNHKNHYANNSMVNMSKAASAQKSNNSDINQLSSQRKNGSNQRKSLDSGKNVNSSHLIPQPNPGVFEIEDYKNIIRNSSQA